MDQYLSRRARELTPYTPGEQPKGGILTKINTNENPYPPSPRVAEAIARAVGNLALYPPPECEPLRRLIAGQEGLPGEEWVYMGNGSDEVLAWAFAAFFNPEVAVAFADVTYSFYPVFCGLFGLPYQRVKLDEDLGIRIGDYDGCRGGIVLANPNAPTGKLLEPDDIAALLERHPDQVVLVDEAYMDFAGRSAAGLLPRYPNLLIVRTLSKSHALAGLRVGYCLGQPSLIDGIRRIKNSYNSYSLDALAQAGASAALQHTEYTRLQCGRVISTRERLKAALGQRGFNMTDSRANFLFVRHERVGGIRLAAGLRERGVLVRRFDRPERIADWLRISVGTDGQMDALLAAMDEILVEN